MNPRILLNLFFIVPICLYSQNNADTYSCTDSLYAVDYSLIWTERQEGVLGYIGDDFRRFRIHFLSIEQDEEDKSLYNVEGKTKVKSFVCDFKGIIRIKESREYGNSPNHTMVLRGEYYFKEDSTQYSAGCLKGKLTSYVYWKNGKVLFNDLWRDMSDAYHNNQFEGVWIGYKTKQIKKCNWGFDRIPNSKGEFDIGVGEFSPNSQYMKNGWETYPSNAKTSEDFDRLMRDDKKKWW